MSLPLTFKIFQDDALIATQDLDRDLIKIGRLASAHVRLDDPRVARIHTVLEVTPEGQLELTDMGSDEGTWLNGQRVERGLVAMGDVVRVGGTTLHIERATERAAEQLSEALQRAEPSPATAVPLETLAESLRKAAADVRDAVAARPEAKAPKSELRVRPSEKQGPLGIAVHFLWGRQRVGDLFLTPGARREVTVGTAAGVDFVLDEPKLATDRFTLVQAGKDGGFGVRVKAGLRGHLARGAERLTIDALIASGTAMPDEGAYVLTLGKHDHLTLELGGVVVMLSLEQVPTPAWLPWQETVNYAALNIFLVLFFLGLLFVIGAVNRSTEGDRWTDELNSDARPIKLIIEAARRPKSDWLTRIEGARVGRAASAAGSGDAGRIGRRNAPERGGSSGKKPDPRKQAQAMLERLMPGGNLPMVGLFSDSLGGEMRRALSDLRNNGLGDTAGTGGLTLHGSGTGGGGQGHNTVGLDGAVTRLGGTGVGNRVGPGFMMSKGKTDPSIENDRVEVSGSIDPELIRRVIHSHRDQIRYCYEEQLNRAPKLAGKVKVRFVITENGSVATSMVSESSVGNAGLEQCVSGRVKTWIFPSIRGGGTAVVSYPFLFRPAGD